MLATQGATVDITAHRVVGSLKALCISVPAANSLQTVSVEAVVNDVAAI